MEDLKIWRAGEIDDQEEPKEAIDSEEDQDYIPGVDDGEGPKLSDNEE